MNCVLSVFPKGSWVGSLVPNVAGLRGGGILNRWDLIGSGLGTGVLLVEAIEVVLMGLSQFLRVVVVC